MFSEDDTETIRLYCTEILDGLGIRYDWNIVVCMTWALYLTTYNARVFNSYTEKVRKILKEY